MRSEVKCRICGSLPFTSIHKSTIGHGEFLTECVVYCRNCHVGATSDDRESFSQFKELALQCWERLMK